MASNEDEEFEGLVKRQSHFVFRVAYAILRNSHDAEDAVQETFLKLYRSQAWKKIEDERAFLARVAWRMAADRLPKKQPAPMPSRNPNHSRRRLPQSRRSSPPTGTPPFIA